MEIESITIEKVHGAFIELRKYDARRRKDIVITFPIIQWDLIKWIIEEEIKRPVE